MAYIFHKCRNMDFSTLLPLLKELRKNDRSYINKLSFTIFSQEVLNSTPFHTNILNKLIAITYQHMSADELK